jgi:NADPH-dependent curcumin reductase
MLEMPMTPTAIPAYGLPATNRRVLLARRPAGIPQPEDFALDAVAVPEPGPGEILVRNIYLSVDPAQRGWASAEANYSQPVPLGGPMRALAVGVVLRARAEGVREGEFLYGWFGWQDYAVVAPEAIVRRAAEAVPLSAQAGLLGINGLTAYLALTAFVGQIARNLGARPLGLTGDDAKVDLCRSRYGYDAAWNYRTTDWAAQLGEAAPHGLDVYFDNVGGPILDTALRRMAAGGRVVQCGTASVASWNPPPTGPRTEREILTRRLVWSGFVIFDHVARFAAASAVLAGWYGENRLTYDEDIAEGIERAPGALRALYAGENRGKMLIYVG